MASEEVARLYRFVDLLALFPISERTLRQVVARLGYRRGPRCGRLVFAAADLAKIKEAILCRRTVDTNPARSILSGLPATNTRSGRRRLTSVALWNVRKTSDAR